MLTAAAGRVAMAYRLHTSPYGPDRQWRLRDSVRCETPGWSKASGWFAADAERNFGAGHEG